MKKDSIRTRYSEVEKKREGERKLGEGVVGRIERKRQIRVRRKEKRDKESRIQRRGRERERRGEGKEREQRREIQGVRKKTLKQRE